VTSRYESLTPSVESRWPPDHSSDISVVMSLFAFAITLLLSFVCLWADSSANAKSCFVGHKVCLSRERPKYHRLESINSSKHLLSRGEMGGKTCSSRLSFVFRHSSKSRQTVRPSSGGPFVTVTCLFSHTWLPGIVVAIAPVVVAANGLVSVAMGGNVKCKPVCCSSW